MFPGPTRAALLLTFLHPSLCMLLSSRGMSLHWKMALPAFISGLHCRQLYMQWSVALHQPCFELSWEWFLGQLGLLPLLLTNSQAALVHGPLCKHTWIPGRSFPIISNFPNSREVNQIHYTSMRTVVSACVLCLQQKIGKPLFSIEITFYDYFLPLSSQSICPHNDSLLFKVTSSLKGISPKNDKVINFKFIQTMNRLKSCLFKNRAIVWYWCCRDCSFLASVFRLSVLLHVPP